ncbi:MAG TPA: acyl carrier protein [Polyangiales bacterium]
MGTAEQVRKIVVEQLGVDASAVVDSASFMDDLGADSLAIVELVLALEENFKLDIPESETEKIQTVGDAIAYIEEHFAKKPASASMSAAAR